MKILMVSVFSNHFFNWVLQLEEAGHELYWFDVHDANTFVKRIGFVHQTVKWKRKFEYPGRQWIKKNLSFLDLFIEKFNRREFVDVFERKLNEIQPDIVHSFEMHTASVPILQIMRRHQKIKWIYTSFGSDIFYYQQVPDKLKGINAVFQRLDYMFSDCKRDFFIAKKLGFRGQYLGTFPGGGGYDIESIKSITTLFENRKIILVKGYQHQFGRCNIVLEALFQMKDEIKDFQIIVFAANEEVLSFVKNSGLDKMKNLEIKGPIGRGEVLELMGEALIYIGNSISDGIPNTLLEAIVMGAYPIQSNPGGATSEIIEHGKNGFLIEKPENVTYINNLIQKAISDKEFLKRGVEYNFKNVTPKLERETIKQEVIEKYRLIENGLNK